MKNILLIIPNLDFGGAQRSFCSLANELNKEYSVSIAVFNTKLGIAFGLEPEVYDLDIPGGTNTLSKCFFFIRRWQAISKLKQDLNIDATISYLEGANYINALSGSDHKILSVRGSKYYDTDITGLLGKIRISLLMPLLYSRANHIVALNNGIKRELIERIGIAPQKAVTIHNFYNTDQIKALAKQPFTSSYRFLSETPYLIYAGRLAPGKGLKSIIDSYNILRKTHSSLILLLVGDGPLRSELASYSRSTGCKVFILGVSPLAEIETAEILFTGYQENPYQFIRNAQMLVIASTAEGGPNILMESLICGTLVASTDCPYGPTEFLAPDSNSGPVREAKAVENGILLPLLDKRNYNEEIRQWCDIISYYLSDESKRNDIILRANKWILNQSSNAVLENWKLLLR